MKLYLEIDIRPYLRMWKSNDNGTSNKKVMKKFYELFAQPSYFNDSKQCAPYWVDAFRGILHICVFVFDNVPFDGHFV